MKILAIIPARGGSKGIPKKNIAMLAGKPLIEYSIDQAKHSKYLDKIVVSSDDQEILEVARGLGAETILRPTELAQDMSKMDGVIKHALDTLEQQGYVPELVVLLQPTSPLRTAKIIDTAIETFIANKDKFDSLMPLVRTSNKIGTIEGQRFNPKYQVGAQRQEIAELYYDCGTVYLFKPDKIKLGEFFGKNILAFPVAWPASLDIDTKKDLELVEYYLKNHAN